MEAGRELDTIVAERVMGWINCGQLGNEWGGQWGGCPPYWSQYGDRCLLIPSYSTDIAAAWLVVEKLRTEGLHLQMNDTLSAYRARFFTVASTVKWDQESADGAYYQFASTPAHAICLAALKALGVEIEQSEGAA
jgi:hypothetical protein